MVKALVVVGMMAWGQATGTQPAAEKAAVCEVAGSGAKYAGRYVELTGTVLGQDAEHLLLSSPDCALGVKLSFAPEVRGQDDMLILFAEVKRNAATPEKAVTGTFEGTFVSAETGLQVIGVDELNYPK